jgi:protease secretion system membrane fusion protein
VQHPTGGIVKEILVEDGAVVKKGQVLVRMDRTTASSQAESSRAQYISDLVIGARLSAERDSAKAVSYPAALDSYKTDPRAIAGIALQNQLFESRRSGLMNELQAVDENIAGLKLQTQGLEESLASKREQMTILKEQLDNLRDLAKDGYIARSRLLDQERTAAQVQGGISEDIGNIGRGKRQVIELTLRRQQRLADYQKEVRTQLSDIQRDTEAVASRINGLDFDLHNVEVKAPVDGTVVGLAVFTPGGVVGPGARLMEIVPSDDGLVVEGQLAVNLIDKVHVGLPVELVFSAFNSNTTPHIAGELIQVSADRTVEERTGTPYYKVRAKVTPEGAKMISEKKLHIVSGMPVEMFVKTGERTMMSYLLKPVFDRAKTSMSEE